jgi:hypothetical protein
MISAAVAIAVARAADVEGLAQKPLTDPCSTVLQADVAAEYPEFELI